MRGYVGSGRNPDIPYAHPAYAYSAHSALILTPENSTTLPHFSTSSAMNLPKSAGEPGSGVPPSSVIRAFVLGSAKAALSSLLSRSTISPGVPLGAPRPYQALAS